MDTELDPESGLNFDSRGTSSNCWLPKIDIQKVNPTDFPMYSYPYGCEFVGNVSIPSPWIKSPNSHPISSALIPHLNQVQKSFMVFDRSSDQTNLLFNSGCPQFPCENLPNVCFDISGSHSTNCFDANQSIELHEDTEEINALLYSDSYDESFGEDEVSTGRSPLDMVEGIKDIAVTFLPTKRRRLNRESYDPLTDTASSALFHFSEAHPHYELDHGDMSSFVNGDLEQLRPTQSDVHISGTRMRNKHAKVERIQETVDVLRTIIPAVKGDDTISILDDAIQYLMSLKSEAEDIRASHA